MGFQKITLLQGNDAFLGYVVAEFGKVGDLFREVTKLIVLFRYDAVFFGKLGFQDFDGGKDRGTEGVWDRV